MKSEDLEWEKIEKYCKQLIEQEGSHYFLEQAVTVIILSNYETVVFPEKKYINKPDADEINEPKGIMHHFVAESKFPYLTTGWKITLD